MLSFIKAKPRRHSSLLFHFHVCTTRQACVTVGAFDAFDRFSEVIHKAVINSKKLLIRHVIVRKKTLEEHIKVFSIKEQISNI